jgi:hypothetical protein
LTIFLATELVFALRALPFFFFFAAESAWESVAASVSL